MAHPTTSEFIEELVQAAAQGDTRAQNSLLQRYWSLIRSAVNGCRAALGTREDPEDLQQEAALRLLTQLPKHSWQGRSQFAAWIRTLATHHARGSLRQHQAQKRDLRLEVRNEAEPGHQQRGMESMVDAQRALDSLAEDLEFLKAEQKAALLLHHAGFSHADIGDVLQCSPEAARKLVSRARIRLLELQQGRPD